MTQDIHAIADFFLSKADLEAGENITHLKLQKLVYYAQAWHLAIHGTPLINNEFEAWVHGPVAVSLYERFKGSAWDPIFLGEDANIDLPDGAIKHCNAVWEVYGPFTAKKLEDLTHSEAPWVNARKGLGPLDRCSNVISKDEMKAFYSKKVRRNGKKTQ